MSVLCYVDFGQMEPLTCTAPAYLRLSQVAFPLLRGAAFKMLSQFAFDYLIVSKSRHAGIELPIWDVNTNKVNSTR